MIATPALSAPGMEVALTFPQRTERGSGFVLERARAGTWEYLYDLFSDRVNGTPLWQDAGAEGGWEVDLVAFGGFGPDNIVIPETAKPGAYRICLLPATRELCTPITIDD